MEDKLFGIPKSWTLTQADALLDHPKVKASRERAIQDLIVFGFITERTKIEMELASEEARKEIT